LDKNQGQILFLVYRILRLRSRLPVPAHVYDFQYGIRTTGLFPATLLLRDHTGWHSGQEPQHYSENIVSGQLAPASRSVYFRSRVKAYEQVVVHGRFLAIIARSVKVDLMTCLQIIRSVAV
jgi:hypothetical protein